ncbi:hypothetical protein [Dyadobacter sp. LHD-138]|uniref:hypothetical protein n=1 Tax=Dyadobacter sp. LHD-138 TaxID=3071413 RepID=UPI0027E1BC17|nr:hypothetical protein [Dyadobacter sp. LHD-138]MDQ6481146.1 hypothetical protein [Dyadobacter sp. LHD-138]
MKIELEVPDSKVSFIMELLESIPFIKVKKTDIHVASKMDTTNYLLSTPANEQRLSDALERSKQGIIEHHNLFKE